MLQLVSLLGFSSAVSIQSKLNNDDLLVYSDTQQSEGVVVEAFSVLFASWQTRHVLPCNYLHGLNPVIIPCKGDYLLQVADLIRFRGGGSYQALPSLPNHHILPLVH